MDNCTSAGCDCVTAARFRKQSQSTATLRFQNTNISKQSKVMYNFFVFICSCIPSISFHPCTLSIPLLPPSLCFPLAPHTRLPSSLVLGHSGLFLYSEMSLGPLLYTHTIWFISQYGTVLIRLDTSHATTNND
jgi:hypothetical protein